MAAWEYLFATGLDWTVMPRSAQIGRFTNGEWEMCSRIGLDRKDKTEAETGTRK